MKILIIEDEEAAASRLRKMLAQIDTSINVVSSTESIAQSVEWLRSNARPDIIFADIHLADGFSFEIFRQVGSDIPVIFTTAYDQYALQAFRFNGIDYLLKPIRRNELEESLKKFRQLAAPKPAIDYNALLQAVSGKKAFQKRIVVRAGLNIRTVEVSDVAYFYTEEKVTFAITTDARRWPIDFTLEDLEGLLDPALFFRINRQFVIHIQAIASMESYPKSRIRVFLKPEIKIETIISAERASDFKEWLEGRA